MSGGTQGFGPWPNTPGYDNVWYLADSDAGWYVVSPDGGECGPFDTEEAAGAKMRELQRGGGNDVDVQGDG